MFTSSQLVFVALLTLVGGAAASLITSRWRGLAGWLAFAATTFAALCLVSAALPTIFSPAGPDPALTVFAAFRWGFALRVYVDGLSAIFLLLVAVAAPAAALYSIPYLRHYPEYGVGRYYPHFLLFLAGMIGLISTTDAMFFFFIFWQMMTLTSFALVRFEHKKAENRRAAWKYLGMMQAACLITMIGAGLIAHGGMAAGGETLARYDFDAINHGLQDFATQHPNRLAIALALFLVGFGIKAGMWPLGQIWLPDAHPAAPSPVSALLSGVMIKTGVYGLLRYFLWLLPPAALKGSHPFPVATWGWIITALGTATMVIGTAQALRQTQTKRLLAYSSIGQVGYMLLGLGMCLLLINTPLAAVATLALYGTLFHLLNHGLFKALLFLNAGSMLAATGTQDLSRLGGLLRPMPWTAFCVLVGVISIAGAPLTSGFASKWTLYTAAIQGGREAWLLPVCAVLAVFTSGLTLAVVVRFYGAAFLSRTSALVKEKLAAGKPMEVGPMMLLPKLWLAGWCLVMGLMPMMGITVVALGLQNSRQGLGLILAEHLPLGGSAAAGLATADTLAVWNPPALAGALLLMLLLARALSKLGGAVRRKAAPWLCGYAREAEANRYQARHFFGALEPYLRRFGGAPKPPPSTGDLNPH